MSTVEQPCYTLINFPTDNEGSNDMQLKNDLEKGDTKTKIEALKKTIGIILSGEKIPGLLMTIIRFVLPLQDHTIKKLLLIFWEIVPKTTPDGKLMQEMILVCDAYRKDLQHPNEFIRGSTLRFLCKLKEPELLEPLMPAIRACLEHRHSYVRRNAVLAIYTIYRNFDFLIPDAPELVSDFLEKEQDMSCKRNAFLMLLHADQEKALAYLSTRLDQVHTFGDILQLVIVELIYKVCHTNPSERSQFIRTVYNLINSSSPAVRYEAAGTLLTLSNAPAAIKAAASCYIELIVKESDNNVKLIVLGRLEALRAEGGEAAERALQDLAMDVLRVLAASDLDVRKKTLELAMDLVSSRNIEEMVQMLRKEATKSHGAEHDDSGKYRQLLVRTLHRVCIKFPDVAPSVIPVLMEFLSDSNELAATDVLVFVREAIHKFDNLRELIYEKLLEWFPSMRSARVVRAALWVLGEFASSPLQAASAEKTVLTAVGELPLVSNKEDDESTQKEPTPEVTPSAPRQLVTSDGTYASQSAFNLPQKSSESLSTRGQLLRRTLLDGDTFTAACICSALVKLALKQPDDIAASNRTLYLMACLLNLGKSVNASAKTAMTNDDFEHIILCMRAIAQRPPSVSRIYGSESRIALAAMLEERRAALEASHKEKEKRSEAAVDVEAPVTFVQLAGNNTTQAGVQDMFELSLSRALAGRTVGASDDDPASASRLSKVTQLTGFSDPVYAEAIVAVNQYDIVLDVLVLNQTSDTLQNCTVELATLGDLRLVERPAAVVLAPHDFTTIKAHVKVASTENGIIFGNIVYDVSGAASDRNVVVLNDIHIDIMDYIQPAVCSDTEFRQMWAEFEWENKVSVNTNITDLKEYLQHLLNSTNMKCLTPDKALSGQCGFMAANLYARSIFGEDALANLSIEKPLNKGDAPVVGHIRIRAKSQGMALSLGDKINMTQKVPQQKAIAAA